MDKLRSMLMLPFVYCVLCPLRMRIFLYHLPREAMIAPHCSPSCFTGCLADLSAVGTLQNQMPVSRDYGGPARRGVPDQSPGYDRTGALRPALQLTRSNAR